MIECIRYTTYLKGTLLGFADFYIPKWGVEIKGCSLNMKDGKRWINFPSKEYTNKEGERKFDSLIWFRDKENMANFTEQAKKAIEKFCDEKALKQEEKQADMYDDSEVPF